MTFFSYLTFLINQNLEVYSLSNKRLFTFSEVCFVAIKLLLLTFPVVYKLLFLTCPVVYNLLLMTFPVVYNLLLLTPTVVS